MRKITFLLALLCVSVMSWATQYCGETITATDGVTTVELTCTNPTTDTYVVVITSSNENFQGLIGAGNYCYVNSEGNSLQILPTSDFVSFNSTTRTLTITLTSTNGYKPKFYNPFYLNFSGAQKEFTTIQNQTFEWPASCSDTRENSDLTRTSAESVTLDAAATSTITYTTSSTGAVTYSSSNPSVATVNSSGVITAVRYGEATITVSQEADASYKAGSFTVDVAVNMGKKASTMGYGSLILEDVNLYDWNGNFAGNNACGVADVYVVTYGDKLVYKAVIKGDKTFESCESYFCQIRTWKEDLTEMREQWAKTCSGDLKTRYLLPEQTSNAPGLISAYDDVIKLSSYMVVSGCGARTMETVTYTRDYVNNCDFSDETAPVLGAATVTAGVDDITVSFDEVTSEDVFYLIEDEVHSLRYFSVVPSFVLPKNGSGLTYNFSCYAIDYNGNVSAAQTAIVEMPFNPANNLALQKTCEGGYYDGNPGEAANKANDGDDGSAWVTYANRPASEEWWYVDLGEVYDLTNISILWGGNQSTNYILQTRVHAPSSADKANDASWVTDGTVTDAAANAEKSTDITGVGRYVRMRSLTRNGECIRLREFKVYGSGVATPDSDKPTMSSASLDSKSTTSATLAVSASDGSGSGIWRYHVVDAGNSINEYAVAEEGKITITHLAPGTAYTLVVTAIDKWENESDNNKSVSVTTEEDSTIPNTAAPTPPARDDAWIRSIYSDTYTWALKHDFRKSNTWGSVSLVDGEEKSIGDDAYMLYDMTTGDVIVWGMDNNGADAIVAKDEYNAGGTGTKTGVDARTMQYLHLDIWSGNAVNNIQVRVNDNMVRAINHAGGGWQQFDIALANPAESLNLTSVRWMKITNITGAGKANMAFDNVYFWRTPIDGDVTAPSGVSASASYSDIYSATIVVSATEDNDDIVYRVKLNDEVVAHEIGKSNVPLSIRIAGLTPNTNYNYTVTATDLAGNAATPVNVAARTKALPEPAPTPNLPAAAVKSLYSDAYTPASTVANYCQNWYNAVELHSDVNLGSGSVLYYDNIPAVCSFGWDFAASQLDAAGYQKLHLSVYPMKSGTMEIYPVKNTTGEFHRTTQTLVAEQWNEIDLDYTGETFNETFKQLGFTNFSALGAFFLDNVYFYCPVVSTTPVMGGETATGGWATFSPYMNVAVPSGVTAYKAEYQLNGNEEELLLTSIGDVIPAGEGVILHGAADAEYVFAPTASAAPVISDNALVGCPVRTDITSVAATNDIFCLRYSDIFQITGFYLYSGQYIAAGKAYLPLAKAEPSSAPRRIRFVFREEQGTTGFDPTNAEAVPTTKFIENGQLYIQRGDAVYTIQGVRVK